MEVGYEDESSLLETAVANGEKCCCGLEIKQRIISLEQEVDTLKQIIYSIKEGKKYVKAKPEIQTSKTKKMENVNFPEKSKKVKNIKTTKHSEALQRPNTPMGIQKEEHACSQPALFSTQDFPDLKLMSSNKQDTIPLKTHTSEWSVVRRKVKKPKQNMASDLKPLDQVKESMRPATLVVYGLIESEKDCPYERAKHDTDMFRSCAQSILHPGESINIRKAFRIGTKPAMPKVGCSPRPVKFILGSAEEVNLILNRKYLLHNVHPRVYFHKDYSLQERLKWNVLKKSLEERRSMGEKGLVISNGEIVKRLLWSKPIVVSATM